MPLEINEIGIRMRVGDSSSFKKAEMQNTDGRSKPDPPGQDNCGPDNEQIVQACVRRVLRILNDMQER